MKKDGRIRLEGKVAETYARIVAQRRSRTKRAIAFSLASVMLLLTVMQGMQLRGLSLENVTYCGLEEHVHTDECMQTVLSCGEVERPASYKLECPVTVHTHTAACYDDEGDLICGKADTLVHIHSSACYDSTNTLVCTLPVRDVHTHTDDCYKTEKVLVCDASKAENHVHTDDCYEITSGELICELEESQGHVHTDACYSGLTLICGQNQDPGHVHTDDCKTFVRGALTCSEAHEHSDGCYTYTVKYVCGMEAGEGGHTHTAACFDQSERTLICGIQEGEGAHQHTAECYAEETRKLICELTPDPDHVHTDECYENQTAVICGLLELHTHTSDCYPGGDTTQPPTCGLLELKQHTHNENCLTLVDPGHTHTAECYETVRVCGMTEHVHQVSCYVPVIASYSVRQSSSQLASISYAAESSYEPNPGEDTIRPGDENNAKPAQDFLTGITIRKEGSEVSEVNDGDDIYLAMPFYVPENTLPVGLYQPQTIYYQLPEEISITSLGMSGDITSGGAAVGKYSIGADGKVYMKFYTSFLQSAQNGFPANIGFSAVADIAEDEEQKVIEFPGTGESLTIKGTGVYYDLSISKTAGEVQADGSVEYTVTVSSTLGSGDNLVIEDYLNISNSNASFDKENGVKVVKNGELISGSDYSVDWGEWNPSMKIEGLGSLSANDVLEITYKVNNVTLAENQTQGSVSNTAKTKSDKVKEKTSSTIQSLGSSSSKANVEKSGTLSGNKINWELKVQSNGANLDGYIVSDSMLPEGTQVTLKGSATGWQNTTVTMPYTINDTNEYAQYTFYYSTDAPANVDPYGSEKVTNTVTVKKDDDGITKQTTVTVKGTPPGVTKFGTPNGDKIDWTITVTRNGVDLSDATLNDQLNGETIPAGTKVTLNGVEYFFPVSFSQLPVQDEYVFTYSTDAPQVDPGQTVQVNNKAILTDDGHDTSVDTGVNIVGPGIVKTGYWNKNAGTIEWEIRVHRGSADFTGATLRDEHAPEGTQAQVWIVSENANRTVTFSVNLGELPAQEDYVFKFSEPAPQPGPGNSVDVTNTAVLHYRDEDYPADNTVKVTEREETLKKTLNNWMDTDHQEDAVDPYVRPLWEIDAQPSDAPLTSFTITDEMFDPEDQTDIHYALGNDIYYSINIKLTIPNLGEQFLVQCDENTGYAPVIGSAAYYVNYEIIFYDENGNAVATSIDRLDGNMSHIKSFALTLTPKEGQESFLLDKVYIKYFSRCYIEGKQDDWSFKNTAYMNDTSSSAYYGYRPNIPGEETGQRTVTKLMKENNSWTETPANTVDVTYNQNYIYLDYRLVVSYTFADNGPIVLTDTLPEGMEYVENSASIGYLNIDMGYDKWSDSKLNLSTSYDPATRKITFTIDGGYNPTGANTDWLCLEYQAHLVDWPNPFEIQLPFTNTVEWDDTDVLDTLTVTLKNENPPGRAEKTSTMSEFVNGVGNVNYSVVLNPKAADIDPSSDKATVTDTLRIENVDEHDYNLSSIRVSLITENTKLYEYDPSAPGGKGAELPKSRYSLLYDDSTRTLTVTFPDELACLLEYTYSVNRSQFELPFSLENQVNFGAKSGTSASNRFLAQQSSAWVTRSDLNINKVDSDNNAVTLPGAKFHIQYWDTEGVAWCDLVMDDSDDAQNGLYTTDANGQIPVSVSSITELKDKNLLISITEVTPPTGYAIPESELNPETGTAKTRYAILANTGKSFDNVLGTDMKQQIITALGLSSDASNDDIKSKIIYVDDVINLTIANKNTTVEVEKLWLDSENHLMTNPPAAQVQLKKATSEKAPYVDITVRWREWKDEIWAEINGSWQIIGSGYIYYDLGTMSEAQIGTTASIHLTGNGEWEYQFGEDGAVQGYAYPNYNGGIDVSFTVTANTTDVIFTQKQSYTQINYGGSTYTVAQPQFGIFANYGAPVTLDSSNNYTYKWENLEPDGVYSVVEVGTPAGYSVTYENNNGIVSGKIIVTNKSEHKEEPGTPALPETGGIGTTWFTVGGGVLMASALVILVLLRKKRKRHPDE